MNSFIQRYFDDIETNETDDFETTINKSEISVILGEPASGKTYQLKEYNRNNEMTHFVELINLTDNENIEGNIEIVLIDSIDEALIDYSNPKKLQKKLTDFIKRCQTNNPSVKFVISCRFLEWSEYFESSLKEIDKELRIYKILPLSENDISRLLEERKINKEEFWSFVSKNYLEPLLKNILVLLHIINNFQKYQNQSLTFVEIYHDLSKKYLLKRGSDRTEGTVDIPIDILLKISSSLATYMTFNRKPSIDVSNIDELAGELYNIDGHSILASELRIVLDSASFEKNGNELSFFHKSIQEYLTAYFLHERKLPSDQLKELLASELRFYEELEEIVVFLTNIDEELFDSFVDFDPFIFKRHSSLAKGQQEKLLLSILNKYKVDFSQVWGRWESFEDSTIVKFDKIDNLVEILKKYATLKEHGYYLMKVLEFNYTDELKKYILSLFEKNISNQETLSKVIRRNFIDNYDLNLELYSFMKEHNLLIKDKHMAFMSFEAELLCSLYGIKYIHQYGFERTVHKTNYDFNNLLPLLDLLPSNHLQYVAPYLLPEDAMAWFVYVKTNYEKNKYSQKYIKWVIFSLLNTHDDKGVFIDIAKFLNEKSIFLYHDSFEGNNAPRINFDKLSDNFWNLYFKSNFFDNPRVSQIISMLNISLPDIKKATEKYPIKNYPEKYSCFRVPGKDIDKYLMTDKKFHEYMENIWKDQEKREKRHRRELQELRESAEGYEKKQKRKQEKIRIFQQAISSCNSSRDIKNIFNYLISNNHSLIDDFQELDKKIKRALKEKYAHFLELVVQEWDSDAYYETIIDRLNENSIPVMPSVMYFYLFFVSNDKKIEALVPNETEYKKLFWYSYRSTLHMDMDYFYKLTEKYFGTFVELSALLLRTLLGIKEKPDLIGYRKIIDVSKNLDKFDAVYLRPLIECIIEVDEIIFPELEVYDRKSLLEITSLSEDSYDFIYDLMLKDMNNSSDYLQYLLLIDTSRALDDFMGMYLSIKQYTSSFGSIIYRFTKKAKYNEYDNIYINPQKKKFFTSLMMSVKANKNNLDLIESRHFTLILEDYYEFFSDYEHPDSPYSPDIYDNMHTLINGIWTYLGGTDKHIEMLEKLSKCKNNRLSDRSRYALTKAYEQQRIERNYPNSHYKKIFDTDKKSIEEANEQKKTGIKNERWYQKWLFLSLGVGGFIGIIFWWQFTWKFGLGVLVISFLIMLFLNPKRRYWIAAWILLSLSGINGFLNFVGTVNIPDNPHIQGIVKFGQSTNIFVTLALIFLAGYLFRLDHMERKL